MKLFDLQVNGAFGVDFTDPTMSAEAFRRTIEQIIEAGVTRFLPVVITAPMSTYRRNIPLMLREIERAGLSYELPGFHLEGPFISPEPGAVGAHNPSCVLDPSIAVFDELWQISEGKLRLLTVAAERPSAKELIAHARKRGVVVSLGHQLCTDTDRINSCGATLLTHLGNGIPNSIDRHRNAIWSGLAADNLSAMIITDGHHLPAEVVKSFIRCKGVSRTIVTSDASSAAGLPPGKYRVLGNDAVLEANGKLHNPEKKCLVGSGSLMPQCVEWLNSLGILTSDELEQVSWRNPHMALGMEF